MKNRITGTILAAGLITGILFSGCSKYEDGPGFSLRSKTARIEGDWKVVSAKYNGEDMLFWSESDYMLCKTGDRVDYTESESMNPFNIKFSKDGEMKQTVTYTWVELDYTATYNSCSPVYISDSETDGMRGKWDISHDGKKLIFMYDDQGYTETYEIMELRENRIKLELRDGSDFMELILEK